MKLKLIIFLAGILYWNACKLEDLDKVDLLNLPNGGYMRNIVPAIGNMGKLTFAISKITSDKIDYTVEAITPENGTLFASYDLFVEFKDKTASNGNNTKSPVALKSIGSASYTPDPTSGYPRASFSISAQEVMDKLGLSVNMITKGDSFEVTANMVMKDGRVYNAANTDDNFEGGAAYNSPFFYRINVID